MNEYDIGVGSVVLSKQGRDKGLYFVVTSVDKKVLSILLMAECANLLPPKRKMQNTYPTAVQY